MGAFVGNESARAMDIGKWCFDHKVDQLSFHTLVGQRASGDFDSIIDVELIEHAYSFTYEVRVYGNLRSGARGILFDQPTPGRIAYFICQSEFFNNRSRR